MAEPLVIGGGGSTAVASEHLLEAEETLRRAAATCAAAAGRLAPLTAPLPGDRWNGTGVELEQALAVLRDEAEALDRLTVALRMAIDVYGEAESRARSWLEGVLASVASTVGFLAGRLAPGLLPSVLPVAAITTAAWVLLPRASREEFTRGAQAGLERFGGRLFDDPTTTDALRTLMTVADDTALGFLGVPPEILGPLQRAGLGSVAATAGAVLGTGVIAGARGTAPTVVARSSSMSTTAPVGVAERVARIPGPDEPVRVERYATAEGEARFEVYIAGTASANPDGTPVVMGGGHPWDMASNVALIAERDSSSAQAVRQALADAGAEAGSAVVFTGYSQGAAVATLIAESGEFRTEGLVTVGAPTGGMPVTGAYPAVVIAHDDDPIAALGGPQQRTEAIVVTAPRGEDPWQVGDPVMAGHDLDEYRSTALRVDGSAAPALRETIDRLPDAGAAGSGTAVVGEAHRYTARRLDEGPRC